MENVKICCCCDRIASNLTEEDGMYFCKYCLKIYQKKKQRMAFKKMLKQVRSDLSTHSKTIEDDDLKVIFEGLSAKEKRLLATIGMIYVATKVGLKSDRFYQKLSEMMTDFYGKKGVKM